MLFLFATIAFTACGSKQTQNHQEKQKQAEAFRNLGEAYLQQGNYAAALKELIKAETLTPGDPYLQNVMGRAYLGRERFDMAIQYFKKALELKPDFAQASNNLGATYLAQQKWDEAIPIFTELSQNILYGTPHFAFSNLGYAYYNKNMYGAAKENYLKALDLEPRFVIALRGLGKTYLAMGQNQKAVESFEKAVEIAPKYPELHSDLAKAYIASKNFSKAYGALEKTIELASKESELSKEALDILSQLRRKGLK